jgi:arginase
MNIQICSVPYDSARFNTRMGAGPERLLNFGIPTLLQAQDHQVQIQVIDVQPETFRAEINTAFELNRKLAGCVAEAKRTGWFPVVFAGNCISALGILAGLAEKQIGVLWCDAHADFNTPETTTSGFLDGMALAILTGRCWKTLSTSVAGFQPIDDSQVLLIGTRDMDKAEAETVRNSALTLFAPQTMRQNGDTLLDTLSPTVESLYLHIDLDVLDGEYTPANGYATAGGLTVEELATVIRRAKARYPITAAAFTAFDPAFDKDNRICEAVDHLLKIIVKK